MPLDGTDFTVVLPDGHQRWCQQTDDAELSTDVTLALLDGRRLIGRGWCQGLPPGRNNVCLMAALKNAPSYEAHTQALELLKGAVVASGFDGTVIEFNDTPGRTKEEVLAIYDAALADSFGA